MVLKIALGAALVSFGLLAGGCGGRQGSIDDFPPTPDGGPGGNGDAAPDTGPDTGAHIGPDAGNDTGPDFHYCSVVRGGTGENPGCTFVVTLLDPPIECGFDAAGNPSSPSTCVAMCGQGITVCSAAGGVGGSMSITCGSPCAGGGVAGDPLPGHAPAIPSEH